jgi:hypothetical protein
MTTNKELAKRLRDALDYTTGPYGEYRYCKVAEIEAVIAELDKPDNRRSEEEVRDMLKTTERQAKSSYETRLVTDEAWISCMKWMLHEDPMNSTEVLREQ